NFPRPASSVRFQCRRDLLLCWLFHMATRTASAATTRRTSSIHVPVSGSKDLLVPTQLIASPETHLRYRIERQIGKGGFGEVYLAERLGKSSTVPATVCIKVSDSIDGWVREAYFGKLLDS